MKKQAFRDFMTRKRLMILVTMAVLVVGSAMQPRLAVTQETDTAITMWFVIFNNPGACWPVDRASAERQTYKTRLPRLLFFTPRGSGSAVVDR